MTATFSTRFQLFWFSTLTVLKQYYAKSSDENIEVPGDFFVFLLSFPVRAHSNTYRK